MKPDQRLLARRDVLRAALAVVSAGVTLPRGASALVVYDPANHAENLIQTARAIYAEIQRNINNQAVAYTAYANQLNLLPLDPASQAAMSANLSAIDDAVLGLRQVQQSAAGMTALYDRLRGQMNSLHNGGDIAALVRTIDGIATTLNRDVANYSSALTSMSAADAQLNAILTQSALTVGAMQAQQISHHLQAMQVREAMHRRQLKAIELQRTALSDELAKARSAATAEATRRQFHAIANMGRKGG